MQELVQISDLDAKEQPAGRVISIPEGMTLADGLRALGGYSEAELAHIAEMHSKAVDAGTLLVLQR